MPGSITVRLTGEEYELVLEVMGYAIGAASKSDKSLAQKFLAIFNRVQGWPRQEDREGEPQ